MKKIIIPFLALSTLAMGEMKIGEIKGEVKRDNIECNYSYPQFVRNGKPLVKLNNSLKKDARELRAIIPKSTDDFRPWDRDVTFKNYENSYGFTSVVIHDDLYTGGKRTIKKLRSINIDPCGHVVDFNDVFREIMNGRTKRAIIKYVNKKNIEKGIPFINPIDEEEIDLKNAVWFFDRDFLIIKFESHTVAPYVSSEVEFKFAKDNVVPYMHYKYGKRFKEFTKNGIEKRIRTKK